MAGSGFLAAMERVRTTSLTGAPSAECPASPASSAVSGLGSSLARTPSRPSSGRSRGIQTLTDALRSKNEAKLLEALEGLRQPNGTLSGLEHIWPVLRAML